ncbi:MAG: hypothetical protein J6Q61_06135 [Bacteroidales bacterium]|nr:hypothetical protein [Bacteroidales bacterium]
MKVSANYIKTTPWNTKDIAEGEKLEGVFVKTETFDGKFGEVTKYVIKSEGDYYGVFGTASLNRQFKNIPEGSYVWIEFKGTQPTKDGSKTVKVYTVEYDPEYQA